MDVLKLLLYALLIVFPLGVVVRIPILQSAYMYPTDTVALFIFLVFAYRIFTAKKNPLAIPLFKQLYLFIGFAFLSLILNSYTLEGREFFVSLLYLVRFLAYSALLFVFCYLDKSFIKRYVRLLALSGFVFVIFGFVQYFLYPNLKNLYYLGWDEHLYRMFSTLLDPNFAGAFFALEFFLLLALFQGKKNRTFWLSFGYITGLFATASALLLTYSRSSYTAFLVGGVMYFLYSHQKKLLFMLLFIFFIGIVMLPKNIGGEGVKLLRTASILARVDAQQKAITIFKDSPVLGIGFNAYRYAQKRYGFLTQDSWDMTHAGAGVPNSLLFVLATTGIVGSLLYINFWFRVLRELLTETSSNVQDRTLKQRWYVNTALIASILGLFVHSLFENSLFYPFTMLWIYIVIGVFMADRKH